MKHISPEVGNDEAKPYPSFMKALMSCKNEISIRQQSENVKDDDKEVFYIYIYKAVVIV